MVQLREAAYLGSLHRVDGPRPPISNASSPNIMIAGVAKVYYHPTRRRLCNSTDRGNRKLEYDPIGKSAAGIAGAGALHPATR